jgi:hypothetical protein
MELVDKDTKPLESEITNLFGAARVVARVQRDDDGYTVDLCRHDGSVLWPQFAAGNTELLALISAEQRFLVEQVGEGEAAGASYAEKAAERLRIWRAGSA